MAIEVKVVKDEDKGFDAFFEGLKGLPASRVKVGIQGAQATQKRGGEFTGSITMVELGTIHEFGAVVKNGWGRGIRIVIPERSFLRSTADINRRKYDAHLQRITRKLVKNPKGFNPKGELTVLGEIVRRDVINRMRTGEIEPPLSEMTKARRGEEGPPLVDTGMLLASIRSVVT